MEERVTNKELYKVIFGKDTKKSDKDAAISKIWSALEELENALEDGKLRKMEYKVGDKVFCVEGGRAEDLTIKLRKVLAVHTNIVLDDSLEHHYCTEVPRGDFFDTYEDAKAYLERQKDGIKISAAELALSRLRKEISADERRRNSGA